MFDLFFNGAMAFQQGGMLLAAGVLILIGLALWWDGLHAALTYDRVEGVIVGVRERNGCYHNVYRYTLADGESVEATDNSGSSLSSGRETGRIVPLLVAHDDKNKIRPVKNFAEYAIGALLLAPGGFLAYLALVKYPVDWMTWAALAGFILYSAMRFKKYIIPKEKRLSPPEWVAVKAAERKAEMESHPMQSIEDIQHSPEKLALQEKQRKTTRAVAPIILVLAAGLMLGGLDQYNKISDLESNGLRAEGRVIRLEENSGSDGSTYAPVISFTDRKGDMIVFKSAISSNPPMYDKGESVTVMYKAGWAEKSARIDHGFWNRLIPIAIFAAGALLLLLFVRIIG